MNRLPYHTLVLPWLLAGLVGCAQEGEREPAMEGSAGETEMAGAPAKGQVYPNMAANVVFENERVVAQEIIAEPGRWTGEHSHAGGQLVVVIEGGTMTYREGGSVNPVAYEAGDVFWVEPTEAHDHGVTDESTLEAVLVTLTGMEGTGGTAQSYPNQPADVRFENDHVVAQSVVAEPGQWAGEHSHAGGQLVVVTRGATLTYREAGSETPVTYEAGDVFWVEPTEAHDHAATGESTWEGVLITLK